MEIVSRSDIAPPEVLKQDPILSTQPLANIEKGSEHDSQLILGKLSLILPEFSIVTVDF